MLQRKVLFGGIIGLVVIALICIVFLYIPHFRRSAKIESEIAGLRKQIKENEAMARDLTKLRAQIINLENSQKDFMMKVVPRNQILDMVHQLVKLGEPYKIQFNEIQPPGLDTMIRPDNADSPVKPIPFIFTVQGKYIDIAQYIESLNNFPYFLRAYEIEIITKEEIKPMVEVKLLINLYTSSLAQGKS